MTSPESVSPRGPYDYILQRSPERLLFARAPVMNPRPPATGVACFGQGPGQVLGRFWAGFGQISELFWEVFPLWAGFGQVLGIFGSVFDRFQLWA